MMIDAFERAKQTYYGKPENYIHHIDSIQAENILDMVNSTDIENRKLAVEILNTCDLTHDETVENIIQIISNSFNVYFNVKNEPYYSEFKFKLYD